MPFSFLNAAVLAGIAAGALPILIHLFSRRRVARIPFSSLKFLEQISRRRVRRVRLTQWLILLLRVLSVILLALALSRPAFQGDFALGKSRGESAVAIVLDRSFSMRAEGERATAWEHASAAAGEILGALDERDRVAFVGLDPASEDVEVYPDPAAARDALRVMEPGFGKTDLAAGIRRAGQALGAMTALNKELFVLSDFQRTSLGAGVEAGATDLVAGLPEGVRVFLIPVAESGIANTAIEDARLEGSEVDRRVRVLLARHGETPSGELAVTVESGAEVLGEATLQVPAGQREAGEIPLTRLPGERENLRVRLSADRLAADDVRYLPALGAGRIPTLLVQDPAQPSPFLPLALSPGGSQGRFEVRRVSPETLAQTELGWCRLLVLDNVTSIPRELLTRIRPWREAGGMLLVVLGDRVDLRFYSEDLLPALMPGVALGNLMGTEEATATVYTLTPRAPGHFVFAGFDARIGEPVTGASFWRIVAVQTSGDVRTLAEFGPGLPAIVEGGGGLLFASSLDGRWNNFPTHAAFLPLLHQSLEALLREQGEEETRVGEPVTAVVERALVPAGAELRCVGPDGIELAVISRAGRRGQELASTPAPAPGFYEMLAGDRVLARRAVNLEPAESDLTPLARADLTALFPGDRVRILDAGEEIRNPVREARYGREFWRELVAVVMLLCVAEAWLARRGVV